MYVQEAFPFQDTNASCLNILEVGVWAGSQFTKVFVDREGNASSQSNAETVSHTGSSHGKLPVSVLHLWEESEQSRWSDTQETVA